MTNPLTRIEREARKEVDRVMRGQPVYDPTLENIIRETVRDGLVRSMLRERNRAIKECADLAEDFGWCLPVYPTAAENNISDDAACEVCRQIARELRRQTKPVKDRQEKTRRTDGKSSS